MATVTSTERQSFYTFVSLDVEEAGKEHFLNGRVFFRSSLPVLYFRSIETLSLLKLWKDSSILQIPSGIWRLIHLIQIKLLHSGVM